jgi:RHS repeat-associated protein
MRDVLTKARGWLCGAGLLALLFAQGAAAQVTFPLNGNGSMGLGDPNGDFFVAQDDLQVKVPGGYARINRDFDGQRWVFNRQLSGLANPDYNRTMYATIGSYYTCSSIDGISTCDTTASAGGVMLPPPPEVVNETRVPNDPNFGRDGNGNPLTDPSALEFIARKGIVFSRSTDRTVYTSSEFPRFIVRPQPVKVLAPSAGPDAHPSTGKPGQGGVAVATVAGFRWTDRSGNWIEYDNFGRVSSYGDRNDVRVWMQYSATHYRLERVLDDNGRTVFTLLYTSDGKFITEARDHTGPTVRRVQYGYDGGGRLTSVIDARGNPTYFTYGEHGSVGAINSTASTWFKIKTVKDAEGRLTQVGYGATARMESLTAPDGGVYNFEYTYDKLKKEFGVTIKYPQTEAGRKIETRHVDLEGRLVYREVNGKTLLTASGDRRSMRYTDERGSTVTVTRDNFDEVAQVVNADGTSNTTTYESASTDVREMVDEAGVRTQLKYDSHGNLLMLQAAVGLPEQQVTEYEFNERGEAELIRRKGGVLADGRIDPDVELNFHFDEHGNVAVMVDGEGKTWTYEHDAMGNLARTLGPLGLEWTYTYDEHGNRLSERDPNLLTTRFVYDKSDRLLSVTDPRNKTYTQTYDAAGRPSRLVDPTGMAMAQEFDRAGLPTALVDSLDHRIDVSYDNSDRIRGFVDGERNAIGLGYSDSDGFDRGSDLVAQIDFPTLHRSLQYNSRRAVTNLSDTVSQGVLATTAAYDSRGNIESTTNAYDKVVGVEFDAFKRATKGTDEEGRVVSFAYDHRNHLVIATDERGKSVRLEYDGRDRVVKELDALGNATLYRYDDAGRIAELTRPNGARISYEFDAGGRLKYRKAFRADGTLELNDSFQWDDGNRMVGWSSGDATSTSTYDDGNRLLGETVTISGVTMSRAYTYYANGQLKTYTGPDAATLTYTHDGNGALSRIDIPGEGSLSVVERKWTDPTKIILPGGLVQEVERNEYLTPTRLRVKSPTQSVLFEQRSTYGRMEELLARETQGDGVDFAYDDSLRLTEFDAGADGPSQDYELDPAANRLSDSEVKQAWIYDDANRLSQRGSVSYSYDDAGNLLRRSESALQEPRRTTSFEYDAYNRVTAVRDGAGELLARYAYDPFGYRISKEVTAAGAARSGSVAGRRILLQGEEGLLAELSPQGQVIQSFGWQTDRPYGTAPIFMRVGGSYYYYHLDALGMPRQLTDHVGNVVWEAEFVDAFGQVTVAPGALVEQPWRFPGQYHDTETGLFYNVHRYYDPEIGRYTSADPAGFLGGLNRYAYVGAMPTGSIDPYGLWVEYPDTGNWVQDHTFGAFYWATDGFDPPDWLVDGSAGVGDAISTVPFTDFSVSRWIRDKYDIGNVDYCSSAYRNGTYVGDGLMMIGGGAGIAKSLIKRPGTVFSHFIPSRATSRFIRGKLNPDYIRILDNELGRKIIDARPWNGNYVTPMEHWLTDEFATLKGRKKIEKTWSLARQLLNRFPQWIPGTWMVSASTTDMLNGDPVDCGCE